MDNDIQELWWKYQWDDVTTFFVFIRRKFVCFSLLGDRSSSISPFRLMRNFRLVNFFFIVRKSKIGDHANEIFFCSICKYMNFVFNTKKKLWYCGRFRSRWFVCFFERIMLLLGSLSKKCYNLDIKRFVKFWHFYVKLLIARFKYLY